MRCCFWLSSCRPRRLRRPLTPARVGPTVFQIGYPDRTGDKFFKGDPDNYWLWGWGLRYSGLFPNDIVYTIALTAIQAANPPKG